MKKFVLLLMLFSPLFAWAQADDMYFVPKKEKKVLVVKSAEELYLADEVGTVNEEVDSMAGVGHSYFTNDLYDVVDDYTYSNRIIRFQSPRRLFSSTLYWDLKYDCGINDWFVYDDGYAVYIYPTANNHYYAAPYYYHWVNRWNWNNYNSWYYPYYGAYNWCMYDNYYHWYTPYWGYSAPGGSWRPSFNNNRIPTNGKFLTTRGETTDRVPTVGGSNPRREQPTRTATGSSNPRREQPTRTATGSSNPRREQPTRTATGSGNPRREQPTRTATGSGNPRREQSVRSVNSGNTRATSSGSAARQQQPRTSVNSSNARREAASGGGGRSSGGKSSSGYSRPSSTSVSRSSGSYNSGSYSSGSSGGGSSVSSGGGGRSGGGARSGGGR